jgi:hypothetical protein
LNARGFVTNAELYCTLQYIPSIPAAERRAMATTMTNTLTLRIEPGLKESPRASAVPSPMNPKPTKGRQ